MSRAFDIVCGGALNVISYENGPLAFPIVFMAACNAAAVIITAVQKLANALEWSPFASHWPVAIAVCAIYCGNYVLIINARLNGQKPDNPVQVIKDTQRQTQSSPRVN